MLRLLHSLAFLLSLLCGAGSLAYAADAERVFVVRGTVVAPFSDGTISIKHEDIPGFMPAMTMPFYADAAEVRDLNAGDEVVFEFHVGASASRATHFRKVGRATTPTAAAPMAPRPRLREGDTLRPFHLVDQNGKPLSESDLKGRHTLLTFIFTRCPVPEFCPRMSSQFQALQESAAPEASALHLLSVSIDPEYDTPEILRAYAAHYGADDRRWSFATGTAAEVDALRRAFAVFAEKSANGLDHALATVLIDPELRVAAIWRGSQWKPEDVVETLRSQRTGH